MVVVESGRLNATTDGVVLSPSALAITFASPPSKTATHEFVVPKSIPIILLIFIIPLFYLFTLTIAGLINLSFSIYPF